MSSKVLVASHTAYAVFKIPKEYEALPLTCFEVLRDTLYIFSEQTPRKLLCEVSAASSADENIDWKHPSNIEFDDKENWPQVEEDESDDDIEEEKS